MASQLHNFTNDQLEEFANDPQNIVLKYDHDKGKLPDDQIMPTNEVRARIKQIVEERGNFENSLKKELSRLKYKILFGNHLRKIADLKAFEKTHPNLFDIVTKKDTTAAEIDMVFEMIDLFDKTKGSEEGKEQVQNRCWERFSMNADDHEKFKQKQKEDDEKDEVLRQTESNKQTNSG